MSSAEPIFYIPGLLAERYFDIEKNFIHKKNRAGANIYLFEPKWFMPETHTAKLERAYNEAQDLVKKSGSLSIYAYSAGACIAVSLLERITQVSSATLVAGKVKGALIRNKRDDGYNTRAPYVLRTVAVSEKILSQPVDFASKITCYHPIYDAVVPKQDTLIEGATDKTIPMLGHGAAIVLAIAINF